MTYFTENQIEPTADGCMSVTVYSVTRNYGGPEEGGWWYDWYEKEKSIRVIPAKIDETKAMLQAEYKRLQPRYNRFSMANDGPEYTVHVERVEGEDQSTTVPHYE